MNKARKLPFTGLSRTEVRERRRVGLYNKAAVAPSKSVAEIIKSNVLTYFNLVFLMIAVLLCLVGAFGDIIFLPIVIANSLIGIIQELRAKQVLDKLKVLNTPVARVIRDSKMEVIAVDEIVLDDIIFLRGGDQIPVDAEVMAGEVLTNEALLTGEADEIRKVEKDELLSGSFVVNGECYAKVTKVGEESYISQLTLKAKAIKNEEQSEIVRSLNQFVKIMGVAIIPIGIVMFLQQFLWAGESLQASVQGMVAALIGMIPEGLFLLTTATLVISATRLARKRVMLHDMKSIEMLARVDTLCVDKTGTITSDKMEVMETLWMVDGVLQKEARAGTKKIQRYRTALVETVSALSSDSETMAALKREFKRKKGDFRLDDFATVVKVAGFSSKYKYSGVEFSKGAFVIGAPELVLRENYAQVRAKVEEYTKRGFRVVVFARYKGKIQDGESLKAKAEAIALIVLQNEVRATAPETFRYFMEQGVEVKVISGDDIETVLEVARQAGIMSWVNGDLEGADLQGGGGAIENVAGSTPRSVGVLRDDNILKGVDMSKITSQREFEKAVLENTVFGRVTPAQKRMIVKILKEHGHTVAMTGDGVNDVLALKDADCSVAMASGAAAAVQVAQVVLLDSDFAQMPLIVQEGRRVVNNLERSGSLFLVKNIFSLVMALLVVFFGAKYPFLPRQVSLATLWTIGVPSFLLAQIPNRKLVKGNFLANILQAAIPAALANVILIAVVSLVARTLGAGEMERRTVCVMMWGVVGLVNLIRIAWPLNQTRAAICGLSVMGMVFSMTVVRAWFHLKLGLGMEIWTAFLVIAMFTYPVILGLDELTRRGFDKARKSRVINWLNVKTRG